MLVLSRCEREGITLIDDETGERIHIGVIRTNKTTSRIGIEAGQRWRIYRDELGEPNDELNPSRARC